MRRTWLGVVAAFTSLLALANAMVSLTMPGGATLWSVSRLFVSGFILGVGILTWRQLRTHRTRGHIAHLLRTSAVVLMMLGVVGTGLAIYHGHSTGDFEYYLFLLHGLLVSQGLLTLRSLRQSREATDVPVTDP